jgi:DNA repair ATPase RecN
MYAEGVRASHRQIELRATYGTLDREIAEAVAQQKSQAQSFDVYGQIGKALKKLREELLRDLVKPLMKSLLQVVAIAAPGYVPVCNFSTVTGKPACELGWTPPGGSGPPVLLKTMSGGEQAVFGAALSVALIRMADPAFKVLSIEAGEVDGPNLLKLLAAIEMMDWPGNVLVATHLPIVAAKLPRWSVHQCGNAEAVSADELVEALA